MDALPSDTIIAFDFQLSRFTLFDGEGNYLRTIQLPPMPGNGFAWPTPIGVLSNGSILLLQNGRLRPPGARRGILTDSSDLLLFNPSTRTLGSIGSFATFETYSPGGRTQFVRVVPFTARARFAVVREGFIHIDCAEGTVTSFSNDGVKQDTGRLNFRIRQLTNEHIQAYKSDALSERGGDWREQRRRMLEDVEFPTELPVCDRVAAADDGRLWMREYPEHGALHADWVILRRYTEEARIALPVSVIPVRIDENTVLAHLMDEMDVEFVALYRLLRK
jgi:hypothetical protein